MTGQVSQVVTHAQEVTQEVVETVRDMFEYHSWDEEQVKRGKVIREALERAVIAIIRNAPPCPDRTTAIRKLREARMDANSAITHKGKY